ncbi:MAG: sigma-54-dependent Fis family transcriptional regulator [Deltaproteobacteria bacterium]|nr:sigma-54-dependent Fis family transcriptional regulator [Deltaproteobacteria bacterium]
MRLDELDHRALLELDPGGGTIRFAGQRALLVDAVAMGLLRKYLVENFGLLAARTVLTQFGFAHGWRMAEALRSEFKWESDDDWRRAGPRIHTLAGLFRVDSPDKDSLSKGGMALLASYEAEQHLLHFGQADLPMCWTICGLTSGYISRATGQETYVLEDRCLGKGDAACHLIGRTRDGWGDERAEELLFFEPKALSECLEVSLQRVIETLRGAERKLQARRRALVRVASEEPTGIVTRSPAMSQLVDLARRVAKVDSTVLITGESGSGKERISRLVHEESARAGGPFIAINCGAIPETLLESELFGHVRGAFTGASQDRPGLFESANSGTLLLDEVGEVSPAMQVKLLRALQEREIRRVGENRSRKIDVRVLAATNRDLVHGVEGGHFRQDLYYRLKVVELRVPALRSRAEDILPLARMLLAESAMKMKRQITGLSSEATDQLLRYDWPGNVRELENAMERAVALARGSRVELEDLPEEVRLAAPRIAIAKGAVRPLADIEKEYILAALEFNDGNQMLTSTQLRIGPSTLYRKLKRYGLAGRGGSSSSSIGRR